METEDPARVMIPMTADLLLRIDDYRFGNRLPSRAAAVRALIEAGLEAVQRNAMPKATSRPP